MKRRIALVAAAVAVIGVVVWFALEPERREAVTSAVGLPSPTSTKPKDKPICSQIVVPAGDCIPQHLANLPPDPGPAGMLTIEGIDSNQNGIRDDVERRIVQKWGDSERAVKALFLIAKYTQEKVKYGGDITREEAFAISNRNNVENIVRCYSRSVPEEIREDRAMQRVEAMVFNTPERFERWRKFDGLLHMQLYSSNPDMTTTEACGYDPEALSN